MRNHIKNKVILTKDQLRSRSIGMIEAGMTQKSAATACGMNLRTVERWWQRHRHGCSLQDKPRSGRPSALTAVAKIVIRKSLDRRGFSTRKLSSKLSAKGYPVSHTTVNTYLRQKLHAKPFRRPKIPHLTPSMKEKRLLFALVHQEWSTEDWKNVLWTDESSFQLFPPSNSQCNRIWSTSSENIHPVTQIKHPPKIMVWGMMSAMGLSELHFVEPKVMVTGEYYRDTILAGPCAKAIKRKARKGNVLKIRMAIFFSNMVFMQDSAPAHSAKKTQDKLKVMFSNVWDKDVWPGNSPDLNVIENLWSILKGKVAENEQCKTIEDLKKCVSQAWSEIPRSLLENLVESMPRRLQAVIDNDGGYIGY